MYFIIIHCYYLNLPKQRKIKVDLKIKLWITVDLIKSIQKRINQQIFKKTTI